MFCSRRTWIRYAALTAAAGWVAPQLVPRRTLAAQEPAEILQKQIPSTKELLPVVGLGTWITFNVGNSRELRNSRTDVMKEFLARGGRVVDSSPMYGSSEAVIGHTLEQLSYPPTLFSATKVWTASGADGPNQIEESRKLWGIERFDLVQVHNLLSWEAHLETLLTMKSEGKIRYIGVTTSHGRRHAELEQLMRNYPLDFIQLTYNIVDREAERRLLPLAMELSIAVIANRPFQRGNLFSRLSGTTLPQWAGEIQCSNWAQFLLKFIVSHPAITCAIPATSKVAHLQENMGACRGDLPSSELRQKMIRSVSNI